MRNLTYAAWTLLLTLLFSSPTATSAQSTPEAIALPESDAMWGGNYVDQLPNCAAEEVCLAVVTHGERGDEYYHAIIHNNTADWVRVNDLVVTLIDSNGEVAAQGGFYLIAPNVISPGGHALVGMTVAGEFISEFTYEAEIDYETNPDPTTGVRFIALQVDSAEVRGNAILGELTNQEDFTFSYVSVDAFCMGDDGSILYRGTDSSLSGPLESGESIRFAVELYGEPDCTNFVVVAHGNP